MQQIEDEEKVTYLGRNHPELSREDHPNFKVYEFSPNQLFDGDNRYYLAGPDWSIIQQSSQLKALHDMLGSRLGYNATFEQWFEQWEKGFSFGLNRTGTAGLKTNYPLQKVGEVSGWREDKSTRPGYLEWKNPNSNANPNYRTIEYFPDRSNTTQSYVLTGSDWQIINHILQIEYSGGEQSETFVELNEPAFTNVTYFRGFPKVNIWFLESRETRDPNYKPMRGRLSFRLVGKTERWDKVESGQTTLEKLTTAQIKQIANRIFQQFGQPTPLRWHKGKESFSYRDKGNGFETYGFCYSQLDGEELITKLVAAAGQTINWGKFRHTTTKDPLTEFPLNPPQEKILGETFKGSRIRPSGFVYFHGATLQLESLYGQISLCRHNSVTFSESKFREDRQRQF